MNTVFNGRGYSAGELAALFSNLAKGCEKQYKTSMASLYGSLSQFYETRMEAQKDPDFEMIGNLLKKDLASGFGPAHDAAELDRDRGALRALKWSRQISLLIDSHLHKIESSGSGFLKGVHIYVCEVCGFIFIGKEKPAVCPVCKVPSLKITEIGR